MVKEAIPGGIGPARPLAWITLTLKYAEYQDREKNNTTSNKMLMISTYSFSILVQFWTKFGMLPMKLLSLIRLHQNDVEICRRTRCIISLKQKWEETYKSVKVVNLASVEGNSPVKLFEVNSLHNDSRVNNEKNYSLYNRENTHTKTKKSHNLCIWGRFPNSGGIVPDNWLYSNTLQIFRKTKERQKKRVDVIKHKIYWGRNVTVVEV